MFSALKALLCLAVLQAGLSLNGRRLDVHLPGVTPHSYEVGEEVRSETK